MALVLDGTNGVSGVDGTASSPSLEGTDSNTGVFFPAADTVAIGTGGTERLRVDSAGNAGLGVTPSAWSLITANQIKNASFAGYLNRAYVFANSYFDGSSNRYIASDFATYYSQQSGQHQWYNAASGTAGNAISFTQAMTLDASGNLGIGTSSPQVIGSLRVVDIRAAAGGGLRFGITSSDHGYLYSDSNIILGTTSTTAAIAFQTNNGSERARITSGGVLLVNTTTSASTGQVEIAKNGERCLTLHNTATGTGAQEILNFIRNGTQVGNINTTGSATAYVTSSDYRLKENVQPMVGALEKVAALKPVTYKWKLDGTDGQGFIAHELQAVVPQCVTGEKDAVDEDGNPKYQGIDTSFLVATLTAAIQEQQAMIDELKAKVAALENA